MMRAALVFAMFAGAQSSDLYLSEAVNAGRELSEAGSGSPPPPPPPAPLSPPGAPGQKPVTEYSTTATMVVSGSIADYTTDKRTEIRQAFADEAKVNLTAVTLTITSGSVILQAKIVFDGDDTTAAAAAQEAEKTLTATLSTTSAATSFLQAAVPEVTVVSAPVVITETKSVVYYPPPPSPPPPKEGDDSMDGGAIAGAVIGSLIGAVLIVAGVMFAMKGGSGGSSEKGPAGVTFTNVNANAENV